MGTLLAFIFVISFFVFLVAGLIWIVQKLSKNNSKGGKISLIALSVSIVSFVGFANSSYSKDNSSNSSSSSSSQVSSSDKESSSSEKKSSSSSSSKESHAESTTDKWNSWLKNNLVDSGQAVGATAQKDGNNYIINVKGYDEWMNEDDNSLSKQLDFIRQRVIGNFDKFQGNSPRVNIYSQGKLIAYTSANDSQSVLHWRNKEQRKELGWIK